MSILNKSSTIGGAPFTQAEYVRYSRHFSLPQVGVIGQKKLKSARVLCIGAGGLGSPLLLYLAAAGVGTIGIVDYDQIDLSNLQRQILYNATEVGEKKTSVAKNKLLALNPQLNVCIYDTDFNKTNALQIISDYDIVADGTDNFATRYLVNNACFYLKKPNVYASIFQFEGQCSVFNMAAGPCYRCLYSEPPPPGLMSNCAEAGVLGVLAGLMGVIQATEVIKIILNVGENLSGRLLTVDALDMHFKEYEVKKNPDCCVCKKHQPFESLPFYDLPICQTQNADIFCSDEITVQDLYAMKQNNADFILLDIREPHEYAICHLNGLLMPLSQLSMRLQELDKAKSYVVHCKFGDRSRKALTLMHEGGFQSVKHLKGGIKAWIEEIDRTMPTY